MNNLLFNSLYYPSYAISYLICRFTSQRNDQIFKDVEDSIEINISKKDRSDIDLCTKNIQNLWSAALSHCTSYLFGKCQIKSMEKYFGRMRDGYLLDQTPLPIKRMVVVGTLLYPSRNRLRSFPKNEREQEAYKAALQREIIQKKEKMESEAQEDITKYVEKLDQNSHISSGASLCFISHCFHTCLRANKSVDPVNIAAAAQGFRRTYTHGFSREAAILDSLFLMTMKREKRVFSNLKSTKRERDSFLDLQIKSNEPLFRGLIAAVNIAGNACNVPFQSKRGSTFSFVCPNSCISDKINKFFCENGIFLVLLARDARHFCNIVWIKSGTTGLLFDPKVGLRAIDASQGPAYFKKFIYDNRITRATFQECVVSTQV